METASKPMCVCVCTFRRGCGLLEDNTETKAVTNGRGTSYWVCTHTFTLRSPTSKVIACI